MSYGRITTETMTDIADAIRDKTGSEAQVTPTQMPERIRSIQTGNPNAVLYIEQELTEEEKAQARDNIGAVSENDIPIVPTDISAFNNDSDYQTAQDVQTAIEPFVIPITNSGGNWTTTASAADIVAHADNCVIDLYGVRITPVSTRKISENAVYINVATLETQQSKYSFSGVTIQADENNNTVEIDVSFSYSNILPTVNTSDNGKFLRVVNGDWAAQTVPFQTPRVAMTASDTTPTLDPNKLYVFPEMATLTPTLATPSDVTIVNEYHFVFDSGATATVLTLPASVLQPDGFTVEANMHYEISILEGAMTAQGWAVTA